MILAALAKRPSDRPATADEFGRLIRECRTDESWAGQRADEWWAEYMGGSATAATI